MTKSETTGKKVASSASKVLRSKTASKAEKAVAASKLTQAYVKSKAASALSPKKVSAESDRILRENAARFSSALKNLAKR